MKTYIGNAGHSIDGLPDEIENYIITHKETNMAKANKASSKAVIAAGMISTKRATVLKRFARTLGATILSVIAAWAVGPEALDMVDNAAAQALIVGVLAPMIVAVEKSLRFGEEPGEDPMDSMF